MENRSPAFRMTVAALATLGIAGILLYILWYFPWWEAIKIMLLLLVAGCLVALVLGMIKKETFHGVMNTANMEADELTEAAKEALKMQEGGEKQPERHPEPVRKSAKKRTPAADAKTVIKD